ncbi:hypothetical protein AK812_SmicGene730 [Symbiodinium microadriaticum]|uniref:Uncharacterized protein n=1 Tax=Symbiodinium microadriaticum TaxID=2951 RepID=A0A1Q9F5Z8_SYMMI|nr:hypothetical protein AK812_SmicGene730 [Symbiodinium microadriaticum]
MPTKGASHGWQSSLGTDTDEDFMHSRFASATAACAVMRAEERGVSIVTRRVLYRQQLRIREIHLHASPFRLHEVVHCCQRVRTFLFERRVDELLHLSKERSADVQPRYDFDGAATVGTGALASWLPLGESVLSDSINADESERSSHATIGQIAIRSSDAVCERSQLLSLSQQQQEEEEEEEEPEPEQEQQEEEEEAGKHQRVVAVAAQGATTKL